MATSKVSTLLSTPQPRTSGKRPATRAELEQCRRYSLSPAELRRAKKLEQVLSEACEYTNRIVMTAEHLLADRRIRADEGLAHELREIIATLKRISPADWESLCLRFATFEKKDAAADEEIDPACSALLRAWPEARRRRGAEWTGLLSDVT